MSDGSTAGKKTCLRAAAVTAQVKHQPLQWNIGSVHRYASPPASSASITSAERVQVRAAVRVDHALGRPVVPLV